MSTPELPGIDVLALPTEVTQAQRQVPRPTSALESPANFVPTPGVALADVKVPGAPSHPDPEPAAMTLLLSRMATELFRAPPVPLPEENPFSPGAPTPSLPLPEGEREIPAPLERELPSPFDVPLRFDAVNFAGVEAPLQVPLLTPELAPETARVVTPSWPHHEVQPSAHGYEAPRERPLDPLLIRREFPILEERINGKPLVWLDNAATTQKPRAVIERLKRFYERENSNIHRAAHTLAARATDAYEGARESVRRFINAPEARDVIFVRGTTEGINLVAQSWGRQNVGPGDEILITWLEHHANIVPWQQLAAEKGAKLKVAPVDDRGQLIVEEYAKLLGPRTKLVSLTQVSNALGTITPAALLVELAHQVGARVLVDGAQSVSHLPTDVQALDADFFVFSGHKVFGPTGIGAVYGKREVLEAMPPWQGGGNMIRDVTFEKTTFHPPPARFEAGTGNIADAVGLGTALDWLTRVGVPAVAAYEHALLEYATERLHKVPGLKLYGTAPEKAGVLSFTLEGQETTQVGGLLDRDGIAVRSGHHCAQPILRRLGVEATVRASLAPYNTTEDIDALVTALHRIQRAR